MQSSGQLAINSVATHHPHGTPVPFDDLVITASHAAQAAGFRLQLQRRRESQVIPAQTRLHVLPDPETHRPGSGGATLIALEALARANDSFSQRRILILHAGGDARGVPAYSALGKLFTPLPCTSDHGQPAALFDLILSNLSRLPAPSGGQVLVASGDVLLTFDPTDVDLSRPGVTGIAFPDSPDRAARHGVYVADKSGTVLDFCQKPTREELSAHQAVDPVGRCLIDTGLMSLAPDAAQALLSIADLAKTEVAIDFYDEIAVALARRVSPEVFSRRMMARPRNQKPGHQSRLDRLYSTLRSVAFHVCELPYCDFFHIDSSEELLAGLIGRSRTSSTYEFRNGAYANLPKLFPSDRLFAFNSTVDSIPTDGGDASLIESCHLRLPLRLTRRNVVTGLPAEATLPVSLPEGLCLALLPIGPRDWSAVLYGIRDDFRLGPDYPEATLWNRPLREQPAIQKRLADEPLWPVGPANDAIAEVLKQWEGQPGKLPRRSLREIELQVNHARMIEDRANLQRLGSLANPLARLAAEPDLSATIFADAIHSREEAADFLEAMAADWPTCPDHLTSRALILVQQIRQRAAHLPGEANDRIEVACRMLAGDGGTLALGRAAFQAVARQLPRPSSRFAGLFRAGIARDQAVVATAPVRLDFAGGWTDTPPICFDRGGSVVNAAITLNGMAPIQVVGRINDRYDLTLTSIDQNDRQTIQTVEQLRDFHDLSHWASLPKAALTLAGFAAGQSHGPLEEQWHEFGGGLELTVFNALPAGAGLGASAILGSCVIACLNRLTGQAPDPQAIVEQSSFLEQMRLTGGGWQDAVGGIFPGIKHIRTQPGSQQRPEIAWLAMDPAWRELLLLYFTGLKRTDKNMLQGIVQRYLAREPMHVAMVDEMKSLAQVTQQSIQTRDRVGFGRAISRAWELKKKLDPGATSPMLERIANRAAPHCLGLGMAGAGGGGFMLLFARDPEAARQLRQDLSSQPIAPGARIYEFDIPDRAGLQVSVL